MVAVIETGGKQYCVTPGNRLAVARLKENEGSTVRFSNLLNGESITAEVVAHIKAPKVTTRKFRNKTRYHRLKGHRQPLTLIKINDTKAKQEKSEAKTEA